MIIRPAVASDFDAWFLLWRGYCEALGGDVPDEVSRGVWQRILAPDQPIWCLVACDERDKPVGIAVYVLHLHTWSLKTVCYLEDLFVAPEARGTGAARALIEELVALGRKHHWRRVYWHTEEHNYRARTLYDRIVPRTNKLRYDIDL